MAEEGSVKVEIKKYLPAGWRFFNTTLTGSHGAIPLLL